MPFYLPVGSMKICKASCPAPYIYIGLDGKECKNNVVGFTNSTDDGLKHEVKKCTEPEKYYIVVTENNFEMKWCLEACPQSPYYYYQETECVLECEDGYIVKENTQYCIKEREPVCNNPDEGYLILGQGCTNECPEGSAQQGNYCIQFTCNGQTSETSCCGENEIYNITSGTCVTDYKNSIFIVTPEGEKVIVGKCDGIQLSSGLCVTTECPEGQVFINDKCYTEVECDAELWNGICMNSCGLNEFYDRESRVCVTDCVYQNGSYCEREDDQKHCNYFRANGDGTYTCIDKCEEVLVGKVCQNSCPPDTVQIEVTMLVDGQNVTVGKCDMECPRFYNGRCVKQCVDGQVEVGYVCMDERGPSDCLDGYLRNADGNCESRGNQPIQVQPDGEEVIVRCEDGIVLEDMSCNMRCPLDMVWIERNCYDPAYCADIHVDPETKRKICVDPESPPRDDNHDLIANNQCK